MWMADFRRFAALSSGERALLVRAAAAVVAARLALILFPFRALCGHAQPVARAAPRSLARCSAERLAWAVRAAALRVPRATCLTQALALQWLLARAGLRATIHVGVARNDRRGFESHAWVQYCGRVVIGGDEAPERFVQVLTLPTR
jgi:hypothetical protein